MRCAFVAAVTALVSVCGMEFANHRHGNRGVLDRDDNVSVDSAAEEDDDDSIAGNSVDSTLVRCAGEEDDEDDYARGHGKQYGGRFADEAAPEEGLPELFSSDKITSLITALQFHITGDDYVNKEDFPAAKVEGSLLMVRALEEAARRALGWWLTYEGFIARVVDDEEVHSYQSLVDATWRTFDTCEEFRWHQNMARASFDRLAAQRHFSSIESERQFESAVDSKMDEITDFLQTFSKLLEYGEQHGLLGGVHHGSVSTRAAINTAILQAEKIHEMYSAKPFDITDLPRGPAISARHARKISWMKARAPQVEESSCSDIAASDQNLIESSLTDSV